MAALDCKHFIFVSFLSIKFIHSVTHRAFTFHMIVDKNITSRKHLISFLFIFSFFLSFYLHISFHFSTVEFLGLDVRCAQYIEQKHMHDKIKSIMFVTSDPNKN